MKLELPPISQKMFFFCVLQTLINLQHRNQLNLYSFGGSDVPPGHSPSVFFPFFVSLFFFFFLPQSWRSLEFSTQFRKTKAFTKWLRWNGEDVQPGGAELGPFNTTLAFPACLFLQPRGSNPYLARLYT